MRKNKRILLFLSVCLLFSNHVYAECTTDERKEFRNIEDNYKITYEFNKDTKDYTLTFTSPEPDKFDYFINNINVNCGDTVNNQTKCTGFTPGYQEIFIIGQTDSCNEILKEVSMTLAYNKLSEDPLCEGNEDFVLCNPSYDKEIDYDSFVSRLNTYKKNKGNNPSSSSNSVKEENAIITYVKNNLVSIITITIFIILVIITIILTAKSIKKSRRLEWEKQVS